MKQWLTMGGVALSAALVASVGTAVLMHRLDDGGRVRAYLLKNPEVLTEAMDQLRAKQAAAQIAPNRLALETPYAGAWIGAARPDVTVVQFYDYACGYCRAMLPVVQRLVKEDPKLRVVFRELPILSRESEAAARVSLAAAEQGKFAAFHDALYGAGRPNAQTIQQAAQTAGLDIARMQATISGPRAEHELSQNVGFARELGFTGTPSWVVGNRILSGAVGYDVLKDAIADARERS